jgi:hypothetical protein
MKLSILIIACLFTVSVTKAQDVGLTGIWTMFELSMITDTNSITGMKDQKTGEDMIKARVGVVTYFLMADGKFKQTLIKPGESTESLYSEGVWKTNGNHLLITISEGGQDSVSDFSFEKKGETLILRRIIFDRKLTTIMSFRKR